jgi:hypothetical protein
LTHRRPPAMSLEGEKPTSGRLITRVWIGHVLQVAAQALRAGSI